MKRITDTTRLNFIGKHHELLYGIKGIWFIQKKNEDGKWTNMGSLRNAIDQLIKK